jgi:CheY-like chemotaxis protein
VSVAGAHPETIPHPGVDVQERLRESETLFALVLQATNEGLWDWDLATNAINMSPRWISMVGYAEDEVEPTLQGFEVLRALKADPGTCGIPVIVLSNLSQSKDRDATVAAGALEHLVKAHLSLEELANVVGRALGVPSP